MKSFQVIRTHTSPYQAPDFLKLEEKLIHARPELSYRRPENADGQTPTILITNTHTQLRDLPPELLKLTKLIVHPNSGYDHFRDEQAFWASIPLVVGHEVRAQAVAEYSLACLFQGLSDLPQHLSWNHQRLWDRSLLKNKSVWVFGYGHIGKIVCTVLSALGVKVTVVDPYASSPYPTLRNWKEGEVDQAAAVIVCCSLNPTSFEMFNDEFFSSVSSRLIFINGARGKLVRESSLRDYLQAHPKAFAFLDVFAEEPFKDNWYHFPQVWKTSHIAGVFNGLDQAILDFELDVIDHFLQLSANDFSQKYAAELLQNKWKEGVLI